jgi:hypothetical protein
MSLRLPILEHARVLDLEITVFLNCHRRSV